jgi:hypothetical protein
MRKPIRIAARHLRRLIASAGPASSIKRSGLANISASGESTALSAKGTTALESFDFKTKA